MAPVIVKDSAEANSHRISRAIFWGKKFSACVRKSSPSGVSFTPSRSWNYLLPSHEVRPWCARLEHNYKWFALRYGVRRWWKRCSWGEASPSVCFLNMKWKTTRPTLSFVRFCERKLYFFWEVRANRDIWNKGGKQVEGLRPGAIKLLPGEKEKSVARMMMRDQKHDGEASHSLLLIRMLRNVVSARITWRIWWLEVRLKCCL